MLLLSILNYFKFLPLVSALTSSLRARRNISQIHSFILYVVVGQNVFVTTERELEEVLSSISRRQARNLV